MWEAGKAKKAVQKATKSQRASRHAKAREAQHDAWPAWGQAGADAARTRPRPNAAKGYPPREPRETSTDGRRPCGRASALLTTCSRLTFRAARFSYALRGRSANGSQRWERMLQQGERRTPRVRRPHRDSRLQQSSSGNIPCLHRPRGAALSRCCQTRCLCCIRIPVEGADRASQMPAPVSRSGRQLRAFSSGAARRRERRC